jgi:hypothetical protein
MKHQIRILAITATLLSALVTGYAFADGTFVTITHIGSDLSTGKMIAVEFDKDIINGVCQRNNVLMFDPADPTQKVMIAQAMIAKIEGNSVYVVDSRTCPHLFNGQLVGEYSIMKD